MSLMDEINKQKELNKEAELKAKKEAELRQYLDPKHIVGFRELD